MNRYTVRLFQDQTYEVVLHSEEDDESVFQGSLSDCEAFIRLTAQGYM